MSNFLYTLHSRLPTIGLFVCFMLFTIVVTRTQVSEVALPQYNQTQCATNGAVVSNKTFRVFVLSSYLAEHLAQAFCQSPQITQHFSHVEITWADREKLNTEELIQQKYHLIWNRGHLLKGLLENYEKYYRTIKFMPAGQLIWLRHQPFTRPIIDNFSQLKIGLVNRKSSISAYQQPLLSLRELGLQTETLDIVYFDDLLTLLQAFAKQQIDVIPGTQFSELFISDQVIYQMPMNSRIEPGDWYITNAITQSTLDKEIKAILDQHADLEKLSKTFSDPDTTSTL